MSLQLHNKTTAELSQMLKSKARQLVRDGTIERLKRAETLMLLVGPVENWPDIRNRADDLDLHEEYGDLEREILAITTSDLGGRRLRDGQGGLSRLRQLAREQATIWMIHGGRAVAWEQVSNYLRQIVGKVIEFNDVGALRVTLSQRVLNMAGIADLAVAVMSAEDETKANTLRTRQNVIHEIGLAQGTIGWDNVIVLRERGVEEFSNIDGIVYVPFDRTNVTGSFGDLRDHIESRFS